MKKDGRELVPIPGVLILGGKNHGVRRVDQERGTNGRGGGEGAYANHLEEVEKCPRVRGAMQNRCSKEVYRDNVPEVEAEESSLVLWRCLGMTTS